MNRIEISVQDLLLANFEHAADRWVRINKIDNFNIQYYAFPSISNMFEVLMLVIPLPLPVQTSLLTCIYLLLLLLAEGQGSRHTYNYSFTQGKGSSYPSQ